jgi:hypothetical protein
MKLVCTITDVGAVVHAGGSAEAISAIIEIPEEQLPRVVKQYLEAVKRAGVDPHRNPNYCQISFSILQE